MIDTYRYDAFISHVSADQAWVQRELLPRLAAAGLRYVLSDPSAATTPARLERTETLIRESRRFIAILSTDYLSDGMAEFENLTAQTLDFTGRTLRVIPVLITPTELAHLPNRLAMLAIANLTVPAKYAEIFDDSIALLKSRLPQTR